MRLLITALACLMSVNMLGQGFTLYNQEFLSLNPSFVGIDSCYRVTKSYRNQWVGLDNNPYIFTASFDTNIKSHNGGFGINYIRESFGNTNTTVVSGIYAHQLMINASTKFIAAIQPDYHHLVLDPIFVDPSIPSDESSFSSIGLSAGCLLHNPNFHIGITANNLVHYYLGNSTDIQQHLAVKAHASGTISFGHKTYISPFCVVRTNLATNAALDLGLLLKHQNYSFSLSVRPGDNITPGIRIEDDFCSLGYSYAITTSALQTYSDGSHTFGLAVYLFPQKKNVSQSMFSSVYNKIKTNRITPRKLSNNLQSSPIQFNEFDREFPIERIFLVANKGEDCSGNTQDGEDIALLAETILLGEYDILERKHFEQVLDEQRLAASGLLLEETAVELGCNAGSQGIIFTEVGCLSGQTTINLKLVGCQTSEIYWSCIGIGSTPLETLEKVKQELSK